MKMKSVLLAAGLAFSLFLTGCSKAGLNDSTPDNKDAVAIRDLTEIQNSLNTQGWQTLSPTTQTFHLWEDQTTQALLLAEKDVEEKEIVVGQFASPTEAQEAYFELVPVNSDSTTEEKTDEYRQATIVLNDDGGTWKFRLVGSYVFGGWSKDGSEDYFSIFNTFESRNPLPAADNPDFSSTDAPSD